MKVMVKNLMGENVIMRYVAPGLVYIAHAGCVVTAQPQYITTNRRAGLLDVTDPARAVVASIGVMSEEAVQQIEAWLLAVEKERRP